MEDGTALAEGHAMTAPLTPAADEGDQALEDLARRLLELLGRLTGLESTYLTSIDWDGGVQRILFSRNVGSLDIPEGPEVDWSDTLCRRALEGGPTCTPDVWGTYPDSLAARTPRPKPSTTIHEGRTARWGC